MLLPASGFSVREIISRRRRNKSPDGIATSSHQNNAHFQTMLRFHELRQNPVSLTFRDETGARVTVIAERLRHGFVNMTCQCPQHSHAGWCKHCLAVLCEQVTLEDDQAQNRLAFENIVRGTRLKAIALRLKLALEPFATAYRNIKHDLPTALDPGQLNSFATDAFRAGMAARQLALAIEEFIKELQPGADGK